ncbi:MAG: YceI family protein [Gemmatimonadota bacterium]|nr:YceI family protein [Gemmatimonadota bacterium]
MRRTLLTISALMAAANAAGAQGASAIRLRLEPGSELSIEGTSNVHGFHCKTNKINAYIDVNPDYTKDLTKVARPIVSVQVNIAVKSLSCGNRKMDENMYNTLKADENQLIKYRLSGYDILDGSPTSFAAKTTGTLTIMGKDKLVAMKIDAARLNEGKATAQGEETLLMSEFGIKPPSFMFGTLKVGDEIKVKFNLKAGPELLAQLAAVLNGTGQ